MKFTDPIYLWLIIIPIVLIVVFLFMCLRNRQVAIKYANADIFDSIVSGSRQTQLKKIIPTISFIVGILVLIIGVSGPKIKREATLKQNHIVIVLDVSNSMQESDIKPTRLQAAKNSIKDFVGTISGEPLMSVITFSSEVNIAIRATRDKDEVLKVIDRADYEGGTAVGDASIQAVELAENVLLASGKTTDLSVKNAGAKKTSTIVLLTDGDTTDGLALSDAKEYAKDSNSAIYTIAMIPKVGGKTSFGTIAQESQDDMKSIAQATGGEYYKASGADSLKDAYKKTIGSLRGNKVEVSYEGTFVFVGLILLGLSTLASKLWSNKLI